MADGTRLESGRNEFFGQKSGIYEIVNLSNGMRYIGSSVNLYKRWTNGHRRLLRNGNHSNRHLQRAWNKYGEQNFSFQIIEEVFETNNLLHREQYYLDNYMFKENKRLGYNITPIAGGSHRQGTKWNHTQTAKENISKGLKGKPKSESHKLKMSETRLGRTLTKETIAKRTLSRKNSYTRILQYSLEGDFIKKWTTAKEASMLFGAHNGSRIIHCCNGKCRQAYGFKWKKQKNER